MGSSSLGLAAAELTLGRSSTTFDFEFDDVDDVRHNHRKRRSTQQQQQQEEEYEFGFGFELGPKEDAASEIQRMKDRSSVQLISYLKSLEDERRKIEAFKRELPLCMDLLTGAIKAAKEELPQNNGADVVVGSGGGRLSADPPAAAAAQSGGRCRAAVLEEFIPLRRRSDGELARLNMDDDGAPTTAAIYDRWAALHASGPASCALIDPLPGQETTSTTALSILTSEEDSNSKRREEAKAQGLCTYDGDEDDEDDEEEQGTAAGMWNLATTTNNNNLKMSSPSIFRPRASAFFPFPKLNALASSVRGVDVALVTMTETMRHSSDVNELHLQDFSGTIERRAPSGDEEGAAAARSCGAQLNSDGGEASGDDSCRGNMGGGTSATPHHHHHCSRKQRRCWSSELHRKFVNALEQLGGAEVATPKLIREIMKVEGLTNDEVKSHLQKYRLHTRKPIAGGSSAAAAAVEAAAMAQLSPQLLVLGGIWLPPSLDTSDCKLPAPRGGHASSSSYGAPGTCGGVLESKGSCGEKMSMQWRREAEANNNNNNHNNNNNEMNDWWKSSSSSSCTWNRLGKEETSIPKKKTRWEMEGSEIGQRWWWAEATTAAEQRRRRRQQ